MSPNYGYKLNIEKTTTQNTAYRRVLYTTEQTQLVVMCIEPGDDIDRETHKNTTQFIRVESGVGVAYVNDKQYRLKADDALVIPAGMEHYIKNVSDKPLTLYTLYSPPEHQQGLVQLRH